jgi:hypothetical protein
MPFGDNNWLALTSEPTLEPELPFAIPITISGIFARIAFPTNGISFTI